MGQPTAYYTYLETDHIRLFTCVCLPGEGKFPTVIFRTPYVDAEEPMTEDAICASKLTAYKTWLDRGYAVVFQHCRGCGKSSGDCIPYIHEREDSLHLHNWVRQQSFYNGELFLYGHSYTATVHLVTAPFAPDIKGAVLQAQDSMRYNCSYRNGFFKQGLHGGWYVTMYRKKRLKNKNYTPESFRMLPLADFSQTVFGEPAAVFNEVLKQPHKEDPFWLTPYGGGVSRGATDHAHIPILLVTGFYDIYTGGVFDMWNAMDAETKALSALAVHPFDHSCNSHTQPIAFENGRLIDAFPHYGVRWCDAVRGKGEFPVTPGKVTYYKLFDNRWCCDDFAPGEHIRTFPLGSGAASYVYDPKDPAGFKGGLSTNFGGNAWQDAPNTRSDILTVYTPEFLEDTFVKGKMSATLTVSSDRPDTCFYVRISLCKQEGDYGLRDDINQISNFCADYVPGNRLTMEFAFDEHAFVIQKGERLRIDISSSARNLYVPHTNQKGLYSQQTEAVPATNTVMLHESTLRIPIS